MGGLGKMNYQSAGRISKVGLDSLLLLGHGRRARVSSSLPTSGCQDPKPFAVIDTLAMARALEADGMKTKHAAAIAKEMAKSFKEFSDRVVFKGELEKFIVKYDSEIPVVRAEVQRDVIELSYKTGNVEKTFTAKMESMNFGVIKFIGGTTFSIGLAGLSFALRTW